MLDLRPGRPGETWNCKGGLLQVYAGGAFARLATGSMSTITSRDNKWLKAFRTALRGKGPRVSAGADPEADELIGIEGPKLVEEALRSGLEAEALLVSESGERDAERILRAASESEAGIPRSRIFRTTDKLFQSVAGTETPQGVAALFRQRAWGLDDVLRGPGAMRENPPLVIVLAAVQDPGNVGTILRSAEAFGATGAVATRGTADPWSPKALRASAGSALRLPVLRGMAIPVLLAQLRIAGVKIYAASSESKDTAVKPARICGNRRQFLSATKAPGCRPKSRAPQTP